ncbi:cytochrome c [Maritimibacter sp. UBA3975]|uniref:c-type cytochrome n=1 Tax=Maritimibacter sp. UBA3975 TaxID=1946833 RepID=UPI0025C0649A|nr:cytochrome c [Maritimibacter sp. UBA3975]|tara:strand:+ start:908 stop:1345 length:438 start_codon:yes stop_codon:yes gene_type:complete
MTKIRVILATAALAMTTGTLIAHADVEDPDVKARMDTMGGIGANMKTLSQMSKGQIAFDAAAAQAAIDEMAEAAETIPDVFETPAKDPESEASDEIWENWEDFVSKAEALQEAASGATVTDEASLGAAMGSIGGTCGSCHRAYQL